ncbi:hypothetical protein PHSC3_001475 [Chlamydiales bacterium STE3]|nr:hypothetical protein PHSC3_001475 [Chlamydiales bacterium STE3]
MLTILKLFGRSPFAPLQSHMEKVSQCVHLLPLLFEALQERNSLKANELAAKIEEFKNQADLTKNDIRNHLPKSFFLALDRPSLLEILAIQNKIAHKSDTLALFATIKPLFLPIECQSSFDDFIKKTIEAFDGAKGIIQELHDLLESSFGGLEAEKVKLMVENVAAKNHEAGKIFRSLLKNVYAHEETFSQGTFILWQRIFESIESLSLLSEKLANRIRMTLELK